MKIMLTGGGTGGHFYPLIAIAEEIRRIADAEKIIELKLYYMSDAPYDKAALFENDIKFVEVTSGKRRMYRSLQNFFDLFKIASGIFQAIIRMYFIYPDVVISKGGYASFPALVAARFLRIPVIIHDSDSHPGRVSLWSAKFARRIGVAYQESLAFFPSDKVALVGQPIRHDLLLPGGEGSHEYFHLVQSIPTIAILGGSSGAQTINDTVVDALPDLLPNYQIIHQTGRGNDAGILERAKVVVSDESLLAKYKVFPFLTPLAVKMLAGAADLIITRAGGTLAEIAVWGVPSIVIPIPNTNSHGDHQRKNAFHYAHTGAAVVLEEANLTPHIFTSEINRIMSDAGLREKMHAAALAAALPDAAGKMARVAVDIALTHE